MTAQKNLTLSKLFNPKSVAVIGASRDSNKIGFIVVKNLIDSGFKGEIYPVNPNADSILNLKCFKSVSELPETPDLAIISLPSSIVLENLSLIGESGIKNVVIYSSGFKEIGSDGKLLEDELVQISNKYNLNVLGPNCLGFANNKLNATFAHVNSKKGKLKFISQSGALAASIFDWIDLNSIGFSEFITLGNKAVLNENSILKYWSGNTTEPVFMYLESISNGKEFLEQVKDMTSLVPVVMLKPGRSQQAKKAMMSHTGSIAGEDMVLDQALKDAGVIRVFGIEEFFDLAKAFSWSQPPEGPNVAVISNAGGPAVISVDLIEDYGLNLAPISPQTQDELKKALPRDASVFNPVDLLGDALAERYKSALETILKQQDVHATLVILTPQVMTEIEKTAKIIGELKEKYNKPIFCSFIGGQAFIDAEKILNSYKIPTFEFPERAIKVMSTMYKWRQWVKKPVMELFELDSPTELKLPKESVLKITQAIENSQKVGKQTLAASEIESILDTFNIQTPQAAIIYQFVQAQNFAEKFGYPLVLKISSEDILHKTESGGVITNIANETALKDAFDRLHHKNKELLIQQQITGGIELIMGIKTDSNFGKVLMFGSGGIYVELIKDSNLHVLPIDRTQIKELVQKSKIYTILKGYRNQSPYFLDGVYGMLEKLVAVVHAFPEIQEIEINPVIVTTDNIFAVDVKLLL